MTDIERAPAEPPDPETTGWVVPGSDAPPPRRGRGRRYLAVGAGVVFALAAIGNMGDPDTDAPTGPSRGPVTTPAPTTARTTTAPTTAPTPSPGFVLPLEPTNATQEARVTRVIDGDTIEVEIDGERFRVRYIGIDSPEPDADDPGLRSMAEAATAANRALVEGAEVLLERDVSDTDRFGRLLRDVWLPGRYGPRHVGIELLRLGFAQVTTFPPDVHYVDRLLAEQEDARERGVGLWSATPPGSTPTALPTPTATVTPTVAIDDELTFVETEERTAFRGGIGDYTWTSLSVTGDRLTVRWDVRGEPADCRVAWRLERADAEVINSTIRVDAGDREQGSRRYDVDFEDASLVAVSTCATWLLTMQTTDTSTGSTDCDPSYPDVCIPPYPPDLDCGNIEFRRFTVIGSDPHGFDGDNDEIGCES